MPRKKVANTEASETQRNTKTRSTATATTTAKSGKTKTSTAQPTRTSQSATARRDSRGKKSTQVQVDAIPPSAQTPESSSNGTWKRVDLHIHTPASHDYEEPSKTYLDILRQAERRGLSIIAFTDHNTVNGYRNMMNEIEHLEYLEALDRIRPDELARLNEYRRLLKKILVLPGFEFTATFGFHILGIFSPDKPLRDIERVLMDLRVPGHVLDKGLTEAGATSDVLQAYEAIDEAGGIAIAAHANSSNGVSMRGLNLGGQTRIAFTQDPHLHAIEFTDLDRGRYSSAHLFTGIKPEYPRRMFAIQGSDAHRLVVSKENAKRLGVGERATEIQLDEVSFTALHDLFLSQDFGRVRPVFNVLDVPDDAFVAARRAGESAAVAFYPSLPKRGDRFDAVLRDACAMANGEGGDIFIGSDANPNRKVAGLADAHDIAQKLSAEMDKRISPHLPAQVRVRDVGGVDIVHVQAPRGADAPYVMDDSQFYVREGAETRPATRGEIVAIARRGYEKLLPPEQAPARHETRHGQQPHGQQPHGQQQRQQRQPGQQPRQQQPQQSRGQGQQPQQQQQQQQRPPQQQRRPHDQAKPAHPKQQSQQQSQHKHPPPQQPAPQLKAPEPMPQLPAAERGPALPPPAASAASNGKPVEPTMASIQGMPKTGVQVTAMEERNGVQYFTVRDLRNNSTIRNVTKKSARDLWHYAVTQYAEHPQGPADIDWRGDRAVLSREMRAGKMRSDVAIRDESGEVYVFYGVTDDGLDARWKELINEFASPAGDKANVNARAPGEPPNESVDLVVAAPAPIIEQGSDGQATSAE